MNTLILKREINSPYMVISFPEHTNLKPLQCTWVDYDENDGMITFSPEIFISGENLTDPIPVILKKLEDLQEQYKSLDYLLGVLKSKDSSHDEADYEADGGILGLLLTIKVSPLECLTIGDYITHINY
jgi:hypothetical protein